MRAIDTNVLVSLVIRDNTRPYIKAEEFIDGGAWVSHVVLAEACWVLSSAYEKTACELAMAVEMFLSHRSLVIQESDVVAAALQQFRAKPTLGFSDCLLLECARKAGHLPLGTFDRKLGKADGAQLI